MPTPPGFPPPAQWAATIREWDRRAIEEYHIPGLVLMEAAGRGAALLLRNLLEAAPPEPVTILCGPGNNGGDGFVIARHLKHLGHDARVILHEGARYAPDSDAGRNLRILEAIGRIPISRVETPAPELLSRGTVVDALFGTGLSRPLREPYLQWIAAVRASGLPAVAIDVPSGLGADSGEVLGAAIQAVATVTFAAPKHGFFQNEGPSHCGGIHVLDIGIPRELWAADGFPEVSGDGTLL